MKKELIICENCEHEGNITDAKNGKPCKAVKSGLPYDNEFGNCPKFKSLSIYYKKGTTIFPDSGYVMMEQM